MGGGYIKLHRSMLDWGWYSDGNTVRVFLHLLLTANYEPSEYLGHRIERGQVVYGRAELAAELGLSEKNVRTALQHLKDTGELASTAASKFSIGTIVNYSKYQDVPCEAGQENGQQVASIRPAGGQQVATSKKNKKVRREENGEIDPIGSCGQEATPREIVDLYNRLCDKLPKVKDLTKDRADKLRTRISEHPSIEWWEEVFRKTQDIPFYCGDNERGWRASLDYITKNASNATKILERWETAGANTRKQETRPETSDAVGGMRRMGDED